MALRNSALRTSIYAMTAVDNSGSRRILEKLGFRLEEIFAYDDDLPSQKSSLCHDF